MTTPHELPTDAVFVELGKLVWAAVNLEDVVYTVCHCIAPTGDYRDTPIGTRIRTARQALTAQPDHELRERADTWLEQAAVALAERNAVLHGEPVTFVPLAPEVTPGDLDPMLAHFPRDRTRPMVHTPLTVAGLAAVTRRIEAAREGWDTLAGELYEQRTW